MQHATVAVVGGGVGLCVRATVHRRYLMEEDELSFDFGVRKACQDVISEVVENFGLPALRAIGNVVSARLTVLAVDDWRGREACFLCVPQQRPPHPDTRGRAARAPAQVRSRTRRARSMLGTCGGAMADAVLGAAASGARAGGKKRRARAAAPLDVSAFAVALHENIARAAHPMLSGRALWAAGALARCFPDDVTAEFLRLAAYAVQVRGAV